MVDIFNNRMIYNDVHARTFFVEYVRVESYFNFDSIIEFIFGETLIVCVCRSDLSQFLSITHGGTSFRVLASSCTCT